MREGRAVPDGSNCASLKPPTVAITQVAAEAFDDRAVFTPELGIVNEGEGNTAAAADSDSGGGEGEIEVTGHGVDRFA